MKKVIMFLMFATITALGSLAISAQTVTVTGDTAAGENQPGWMFNRDPRVTTDFEFNGDEASIGAGSLFVAPITNTQSSPNPLWDKLIAENFILTPAGDVSSISFDFYVANGLPTTAAKQFYLNVYVLRSNLTQCRFDYVPAPSPTGTWHTLTYTPTTVRTAGTTGCPTTVADLLASDPGAFIRMFSLNVGDTSVNDANVSGYLDNVVVVGTSGTTTYDFEPVLTPSNANECKKGGWMNFNTPVFKNQGDCVSYVVSGK